MFPFATLWPKRTETECDEYNLCKIGLPRSRLIMISGSHKHSLLIIDGQPFEMKLKRNLIYSGSVMRRPASF